MAIAICGLFFGLVISPKSQNQNLPTGSIKKKNAKHPLFSSKFREHPSPKKKQTSIETIRKKTPVSPYMAQKTCNLPVSLLRSCRGNFWLTTREIKSPTGKKKSSINSQPSRFFPRGTPTSLGPLKGTASVRPWPKSGRGGCFGFLFGIIL